MSTFVSTPTYTHAVTHVTDKLLTSLGTIIRDSGLSMAKYCDIRDGLEGGIKAWMESGHLEKVVLEIYEPGADKLIKRWDFDLFTDGNGEMGFWFDADDIRYHLLKSGQVPSRCEYAVKVTNKPGRPDVPGWSKCSFRDTSHLRQFCLGTTIAASNTGTRTSYWK